MAEPASRNELERGAPGARTVTFGHVSLGITWDSPALGEAVGFLFSDLPEGPHGATPTTTLRLTRSDTLGKHLLHRDEDELWRGRSLTGVTSALLDAVQRELADQSRSGAMFHAAALTKGGRALVLPGGSGAGKTSLCAWLLSRGCGYLTDELTFVESSSGSLECFSRPLHVKRSGYAAVLALLPAVAIESLRATPSGRLVPHRLLSSDYQPRAPEVGLLLFPRFDPLATCELQPLSRADAARRLVACLINGRNLEGHGFAETTRLARAAEAYSLVFGDYQALGPALDPLLARRFGP